MFYEKIDIISAKPGFFHLAKFCGSTNILSWNDDIDLFKNKINF